MKPTYYYINGHTRTVEEVADGVRIFNGEIVFPNRQMALIALHCTLRRSCEDYQRRIDEIVVSATAIEKEIEELMKPHTFEGGSSDKDAGGGC